jgi:hypothetical protein
MDIGWKLTNVGQNYDEWQLRWMVTTIDDGWQ